MSQSQPAPALPTLLSWPLTSSFRLPGRLVQPRGSPHPQQNQTSPAPPPPPTPADEAMFRMDAKLASYFATLKEGRGGGAARAARDELINFKMRVAGLVEAFCKRVSQLMRPPASAAVPQKLLSALAAPQGAVRGPAGAQCLLPLLYIFAA